MARRTQNARSKSRVRLCWPLLVVVYLAIIGRVVFLQTWAAPDLREKAAQDRKDRTELPAQRGRILDRNGRVLAFNVEESSVVLHPDIIGDKRLASRVLARHVGIPENTIHGKLTSGRKYVPLARSVPVEDAIKLKQELLDLGPGPRINGVEVSISFRRVYPMGKLGAKLIGAVNAEGHGIAGVERWADKLLAGKPGCLLADCDRNGRAIPTRMRQTVPAEPGRDIVLTIDSRIQFAAEQALERQVKAFQAQSGSCVILDPWTGEVLGLAEAPSFNPNRLTPADVNRLEPYSLTHLFEPGSTMKLFTAAAALEHGLSGTTCTCKGSIPVGDGTVRCPCNVRHREPGAPVTVKRMLQYSCNTEAITLGRRLGSQRLYDETEQFGLLTRLDVPGLGKSVGGQLPDPGKYRWASMRLANVSFGQGVATSRLNLVTAYAAVANGGELLRPQIIREIRTAGGRTEKTLRRKSAGKVLEPGDAAVLRDYLRNVVENGTGKSASIEGVAVGGKTGSAQIAGEGSRGFIPGAYVTSFCGMAPVSRPEFVMLVTVERPKGSTHGATVAAPVFREVGEKVLWCTGHAGSAKPAAASTAGKVFGGRSRAITG